MRVGCCCFFLHRFPTYNLHFPCNVPCIWVNWVWWRSRRNRLLFVHGFFFPVSSLFFVIIINNFFITDKMLKDQNSMHILKPFDKQNIICKRLGKVSYFDRQLVNTTIRFMNFYVSVVSMYFYLYACVCLMQCDCNRIYKTITVAFTVSSNGKCTFFYWTSSFRFYEVDNFTNS